MHIIKHVRISEERLPVLIGRQGKTKREIEDYTKTRITVDDAITIDGEAVDVMTAENIVRAIGRGFSPDVAMELLDEENTMVVITLNPKSAERIKSRVIGTKGKTRGKIEKFTKTYLSVYGKTISIIGAYKDVEAAAGAVEKFIKGSTHKTVYTHLEKRFAREHL